MVILGPATAIVVDRQKYDPTHLSFPFMATQFTNVLGSAVLLGAGLIFRKDAATHNRLMLMGTIALTEPGFSRFLRMPFHNLFDDGFWPYLSEIYPGTITLMLCVGAYDYMTRKQLRPGYLIALAWLLGNEFAASWLYGQLWWATVTTRLLGH